MKAAAYARVSTADQVDGFSLSAQLRAIRAHCASQGWTAALSPALMSGVEERVVFTPGELAA